MKRIGRIVEKSGSDIMSLAPPENEQEATE
jgi:hypothetical protein